MTHKHQLVYVCQAIGEYGGDYPVHWCRDCGAVVAVNHEMVPECSKRSRLGRGLLDAMAETREPAFLRKLLGA